MRIPRFTRRRVAAPVTALAAAGLALALTAGPAMANPQPNQEWYGNQWGQSNFHYLGNPSSVFSGGIQIQSAWGNYPYLKCLDIDEGLYDSYSSNGSQPELWDCNGNDNQKWSQSGGADSGTWTYQNYNAGNQVCLDAQDGWAYDGAPLKLHFCNYPSSAWNGSQEWTIGPNSQLQSYSDGVYYHDSLCADVRNDGQQGSSAPANGTLVQLWQCAY